MAFTEVSYKVNTMGAAIFTGKIIGKGPGEVTLIDFKELFQNRHHVNTNNFRYSNFVDCITFVLYLN